jgi:transcriptional regulator with XRE-family HTH domain
MDGLENKEIFSQNLHYFIERRGVDRTALCDALDIPYTTLAGWLSAATYPRITKLQKLADYFGIAKSDLTEDKPHDSITFGNLTEKQMEVLKLIAQIPSDKIALIEPILREAIRLTHQ